MAAPLRILTVSDVSPAVIVGGAEREAWEQASRLAERGHQIRFISRSPDHRIGEVNTQQHIEIQHFPVDRRSLRRFLSSSILGARRTVAREMAQRGADVLHLQQPLSGFGVLTSRAGRTTPSLYTFHSPAPLEYRWRRGTTALHRGGWIGIVGVAVLWAVERACLRRATRIHVLSDYSADLLRKLYRIPRDRIVKIPGGVDAGKFRPAGTRQRSRNLLALPPEQPILFSLRNLEPRMGLDTLIRAIAILRRSVPNVLLVIGGAGSQREKLGALTAALALEGSIRFTGFIPEDKLPVYYQAADAFVLPSRALEGFGLVTIEALACGTPVFGTPVGATPEILSRLDRSLLFRDATAEAMAAALERFLTTQISDPVSTQRRQAACRRYVETYYTLEHSVAKLEAEFTRLAASRQTPQPLCSHAGQATDRSF